MSLPATTEFTAELGGAATKICCQRYSDSLFLIVTQLPAFGTLVEARAARGADGRETVSVRTLLGERDCDVAALCARMVLDCMRADASAAVATPVLLSLGLRPENARVEVVRELKALLERERPWAPPAA